MIEFNYSKTVLKKRYHILLLVFLICPLLLFGFGLYLTNFDLEKSLILTLKTTVMLALTITLVVALISPSLKKMKIIIADDQIIKKSGKIQQSVFWPDIQKVKIIKNYTHQIVDISIIPNKKPALSVNGFEQMDKIAHLIQNHIDDQIQVQIKQFKYNYLHPAFLVFVMISTVLVLGLIHSAGLFEIFIPVFAFTVGFGILIFGPARKANMNIRWFEILMGILLIACSLFLTLCFLFPDFFNQY